jgi:hypothetical protein
MSMNRKGFFKTIFGGILAATAAPAVLKAQEEPQKKDLTQSRTPFTLNGDGDIGLGTSYPKTPLVVSGLIFEVGERKMQMSGNEKGDFEIKWLNVKEKEAAPVLTILQPNIDPWKTQTLMR